jgi:hypothetical protein
MTKYGSLDVTLTLPAFDADEWVGVKTDIFDSVLDEDGHLSVRVYEDRVELVSGPSETVVDQLAFDAVIPDPDIFFDTDFLPLFQNVPDFTPLSGTYFYQGETLRITAQNDAITLYRDGDFMHSFFMPDISYPDDEPVVTLLCSSGWDVFPTVGIQVIELDDWREAVYLELEGVAASGISAIIQDRPVNILSKADGTLAFCYDQDVTPIAVSGDIIRSHTENESDPMSASDAVIEGRDVATTLFPEFADEIGYSLSVIHIGSLDSGEKKAAKVGLRRGLEAANEHILIMRPDLRLEPNDEISVSYNITGTNTLVTKTIIVMGVRVSIEYEEGTQEVSGRRKL